MAHWVSAYVSAPTLSHIYLRNSTRSSKCFGTFIKIYDNFEGYEKAAECYAGIYRLCHRSAHIYLTL